MSKTKILLIQVAVCLVLGTVMGTAFWIFDGGKTREKASVASGGHPNAQGMALASESKTVLICHSSGPVSPCPRSVKVYQGQWIEDTKKIGDWWSVGYLQREVIK